MAGADGHIVHRRDIPARRPRYDAVATGVIFIAATLGLPDSSLTAERLAERHAQRTLDRHRLAVTAVGIGGLIGLAGEPARAIAFAPGLPLVGLGWE